MSTAQARRPSMIELLKIRGDLKDRAGADSTTRCYAEDWRDLLAFLEANHAHPPATAETLELYLIDAAKRGLSMHTLRRRITGIVATHRQLGLRPPETRGARKVLRELARQGLGQAQPKRALAVEELRTMAEACEASPVGLRDRAILLTGFSSGMRRSELAALDLADVTFSAAGAELRIRGSKTDQQRAGRIVALWRAHTPELCAITAIDAWLKVRGRAPGPLWTSSKNTRIEGRAIAQLIKRRATAAGIPTHQLAAHSLRAGMVTASLQTGASLPAVMQRTGHRTAASIALYYRPATAWAAGDPLANAL